MLSGDPNKILVEQEAPAEDQPPADDGAGDSGVAKKPVDLDDDKIELPKKNFTELHRLSQIVGAIENEVQIVPVGAYKLTPNHELHPNPSFQGLKLPEATNIKNWQHFRAPQSHKKQKEIQSEDVIFKYDFLDPISEDLPKGCWSLQRDCTNTAVTVRSLLWPGYSAYLRVSTGISGAAYFGDGLKNVDLAFLL